MWSRSEIHCGSRRVDDSSSCWTRVGDCTWCNRCRCTTRLRRSVPLYSLWCIHLPHVHDVSPWGRHPGNPLRESRLFPHCQFLVTEGTHGFGMIISIDLGSVLEGNLSKRYVFTLTCNCNRYSMKERISFFLVWCMEDPQMSLYGWNAWHGQTEQHDRLVFVIVVNGWLEVSVHDDRWWYFESLVGRFVNRRHV